MQKITLDLEVRLTPKELQQKGQEMASTMLQYDEYEAEKKAIANDLGAKMKELHAKLTALAKVTKRKTEVRSVECEVQLNTPETGTKRIIRTDTEEIIKELAMTLAERQTELFAQDEIERLQAMFDLKEDPPPPEPEPEQPSA
jgi:hypothetical protein